MALLRMASVEYGYDIDPGEVARIWRAGCIIRATLLEDIRAAFAATPDLVNLLVAPVFAKAVADRQQGWRTMVSTAVTLGNIDVLIKELDRLYGKRMRVWVTEYGYQTNPPDRFYGVTYSKQAKYLTQAVSIARANTRIDVFLWFLLRDEQRLGGWQSGLTTFQGKRKPSFNAFRRAALG